MNVKKARWWRDPRFVIPGILIPIFGAVIGVVPKFIGPAVASKLTVVLGVRDPRRPDTQPPQRFIMEFTIEGESSAEAAARIIKDMIDKIDPRLSRTKQSPIPATVEKTNDGTLLSIRGAPRRFHCT